MIDWSQVSPALKSLFARLAVDQLNPDFLAEWSEGAQSYVHPGVGKQLMLKVTTVAPVGRDELRYEEMNGELFESIHGMRRLTLEVRVDSYFHDPDQGNWCWSMLDRIITRLRRRSSLDALLAVGLSLVSVNPAVDASFTYQGQRVNTAVADVVLYGAFADTDSQPTGWIERIELTSKVRDPAGDALPSPPNFTDELIPGS